MKQFSLIFYDITSDKLRTRMANKLEELSFVRLQYSVFCGSHTAGQLKYCKQELSKISIELDKEKDKFGILPIGEEALIKMSYLGEKPNMDKIFKQNQVLWI